MKPENTEVQQLVKRLLSEQEPRRPDQLVAFIYARCSHDPKGRGLSVERQVEDCWRDCQRNGWYVKAIYVDNHRSASYAATKDREDYQRMIAAMASTLVNVLVCWEASRATRDVRTYLDLAEISREQDVKWCFNGTMYNLLDEDDEFRTLLETVLGHREVRKLARRVRDGQAKAARDGRPHGKVPYGYFRVYDERTRAFISQEIDDAPREATNAAGVVTTYSPAGVVRDIVTGLAGADSVYNITKELNRKGIPAASGGPWSTWQVRQIAFSLTYAGWRIHRGEMLRLGQWEAIVDHQTMVTARLRLEDPKRKTARSNKAKHLLSLIAACGMCSVFLTAQMKKRNGIAYYLFYRCPKGCVAIRADRFDAYVESVIIRRLSDPTALDWLIRPDDTDAQRHAEEAAGLRATVEKWKEKAKAGAVDPDEYADIVGSLKARIAELDAKSTPTFIPITLRDMIGEQAAQVWDRFSLAGKRDIIKSIMTIEVWRGNSGERAFDPSRVKIDWILAAPKSDQPAGPLHPQFAGTTW